MSRSALCRLVSAVAFPRGADPQTFANAEAAIAAFEPAPIIADAPLRSVPAGRRRGDG